MDIHKVTHSFRSMFQNGHLSFVLGLLGLLEISKLEHKDEGSDFGDVPGDNVLPKNLLISFSSRKGL